MEEGSDLKLFDLFKVWALGRGEIKDFREDEEEVFIGENVKLNDCVRGVL